MRPDRAMQRRFAPAPVLTEHHFEVIENSHGYWVARKGALRFALFEAAGDSAYVKVISPPDL